MNTTKILLAVAVLVGVPVLNVAAQQTAPAAAQAQPTAAPAATPAVAPKMSEKQAANWGNYPPAIQAQAIRDQEWLTAYMMANQGYRLDHMEALEDKFSKMSPTQLETLKMFYEQKHNAMVQQQQLWHQAQQHQLSYAQSQLQQQTRAMNMINQEETGAATTEDQRLNMMHQEAFEANQDKEAMQYPYGMGGYANPYGGRGYGPYRAIPPY